MEMKDWFEYMNVFEETMETFGKVWIDEETGEHSQMDREMIFSEYVDACRHAGLPMDDEPEMPDDFMVPYHL